MQTVWNLHYEQWVLEDGGPHLQVGEIFEWFAVSFYTSGFTRSGERTKSAIALADYRYSVSAELEYLSETACVIDFGLRAAAPASILPPTCKQGEYLTGEIAIRLPLVTELPFEEAILALGCKWQLEEILADLTPYISHPDNPRLFSRDESQIRYEQVVSTYLVRAKDYVLRCSDVR